MDHAPGKNCTDRQRIKRKAERWARKFAALAPYERMAIMQALHRAEPQMGLPLDNGDDRCLDCGARVRIDSDHKPSCDYYVPLIAEAVYVALKDGDDVCRDCGHGEDEHDFDGCFFSDSKMVCECQCFRRSLSPMPDSGATKLSPRESAEAGGPQCS